MSTNDATDTLAFTAAGNNIELAIAVAIATWGATGGQALRGSSARSSRSPSWSRWSTCPCGCAADSSRLVRGTWSPPGQEHADEQRRRPARHLYPRHYRPDESGGPATTGPRGTEPALDRRPPRPYRRGPRRTVCRGLLPRDVAARLVESHELLSTTARVDTHLTVLAARVARERLTAAAQARGALVSEVPEVLFVCVHNAGRSQMAAALLDHHAQGAVHVRSAGSTPADEINPAVREAMTELGLDLSREFPKPLTTDVVEAADVVITMGCGDACPVFPGKGVDDVRPIRDDIDQRVRALLTELVPASTT